MCPPCQGPLKGQAERESRKDLGGGGNKCQLGPRGALGQRPGFLLLPRRFTPQQLSPPWVCPHPWLLPHLASHHHGNTGDAMMSPEMQKSSPLLWFGRGGGTSKGRARASLGEDLELSRRGHVLFNKSLITAWIFKS